MSFSCKMKLKETVDKEDPWAVKIDSVLSKMTLQEKIGQTAQRGKSSRVKEIPETLKAAIRAGAIGSLLNISNPDQVLELQKIAVEESPNGIPILFGRDVIHGHKTIFPIPLGQAAMWNPELVKEGSRIAAMEATSVGIKWTFAPMLDIARDPRWGRIAESPGEDPYLASVLAKAYIEGFQGEDLSDPTSIVACAKHFAGYGAAEGGRDYNTANINQQSLHNVYLKPFKAAVDARAGTFMTGFNELNGVPASGNKFLLKKLLRDTWNYDGFVVSDWESIKEMIPHGYAADGKHAAELAANAGCDMEMTSTTYEKHLATLIEEGKFSEKQLDDMVRNILRIKFRAGLFEHPYFEKKTKPYEPKHLEAAQKAATESIVLLKNENDILPLLPRVKGRRIAAIGPMLQAPHDQLGTWTFDGDETYTKTPFLELLGTYGRGGGPIIFEKTLTHSRDKSTKAFAKAIAAANTSDVIVFFGGEEAIISGEAHSRANINLPGAQEDLILALAKTGKPIVLVLMAGRPITLGNIIDKVDAVLMTWHPGTMGGPAIADVLSGKISPSGRLPISWPKVVGQIPIHYNHKNTGRPVNPEKFVSIDSIPIGAWQSSLGNTSHYLDAGYEPQYPFGYGLTYSSVTYENLKISNDSLKLDSRLKASVTLTNTGNYEVTEVAQLYIQDITASITRPVRELKGFERVTLQPEEQKTVTFELAIKDLEFYNTEGNWVVEPGKFKLWIGPDATRGPETSFVIK